MNVMKKAEYLDVIVCKMQDIMIELLLILQNGSEVE
jgi:hypothetical protein